MTWANGRQLSSVITGSGYVGFAYNADGRRLYKTDGTNETIYLVVDGVAVGESINNGQTVILYLFDENGDIYGINVDDTNYFFRKNLQGDVVGIWDANGNEVVTYTYDPWGKLLSVTDNSGTGLGTLNPFRYRTYYYDTETGFYYLQSRYYDPEIGRFINADGLLAGGNTVTLNLFAYCGNNPVNHTDSTGHAWWHWAIGAAIVVACAAATVVTCGGFAAAATAVCAVSAGVAAATTASTVAAGALIGSATVYSVAVVSAVCSSNSVQEFCDQGNWGTVAATATGGFIGGYGAGLLAKQPKASSSPSKSSPISKSDAKRIQNAANRTHQTITVVGSRADGTAGPNSDWDYIMSGNSAQRHSAASSVPSGVFGGENNTGIDIFSSYIGGPNPVVLDRSKPYIEFFPQ